MNITSLQNSHVKEWVKLNNKKYRDEVGLFLIEGEHLINEAKKENCLVTLITTNKQEIADFYVTPEIMKKISNQKSSTSKIAVCKKKIEKPLGNKVLVLDGIQDPGNLGTMIRSAVAFSFDSILLSEDSVDVYNDKTIRATEGMLFKINIVRKNLEIALTEMQKNYQILATDVNKGKRTSEMTKEKKLALIIGNEGSGMKESTKTFASEFLKIPMSQECESLNAGVAASIFMYELGDFYD